jgi:hypothetical protein
MRRLPLGLGRGLAMEIDFDRDSRYWLGIYERELARHIRALCPPGGACFDLGSASGFYALVFAQCGATCVLAVEADASSCERLRRNVAANPELASSIEVSESRVGRETSAPEGTVTIDELAYGPGGFVPDLVKMDVEGNEVAALRGAQRLLAERRPHMIIETHSEDLDAGCRWLLEDNGYAVETVEPRPWMPEVRTLEFNRWCVARGDARP